MRRARVGGRKVTILRIESVVVMTEWMIFVLISVSRLVTGLRISHKKWQILQYALCVVMNDLCLLMSAVLHVCIRVGFWRYNNVAERL